MSTLHTLTASVAYNTVGPYPHNYNKYKKDRTAGVRVNTVEVEVQFKVIIPQYMFELNPNHSKFEDWNMQIHECMVQEPQPKKIRILSVWKRLPYGGHLMEAWNMRDEIRSIFKLYK